MSRKRAIQCTTSCSPNRILSLYNKKNKNNMNYTFTQDGITENITPERWVWGVVYKDDTELHQFSGDGTFHQFKEVRQEDVKMFVMYQLDSDLRFDMAVTDNMQIFHFYRTLMLDQGTDIARTIRVYVYGWKSGDATSYNYIMPNNRLLTANHDLQDLTLYGI